MKFRIFFLFFILSISIKGYAQLTLEEIYENAYNNYPQIKQYDLISKSEEYNLSNIAKAYLPQFSLSGKATYQTDVTEIPVSIPGIKIPSINKEQYQIVAEINQLIWDGGNNNSQKQIIKAQHEVEQNQIEVEMFAIRERINNIFFGILHLSKQMELNKTYHSELLTNYNKIKSAIENGVANQTDLNIIQAELLLNTQQNTKLLNEMKSYSTMLSFFMGGSDNQTIILAHPEVYNKEEISMYVSSSINSITFHRPEISYFSSNIKLLEAQKGNIKANNLPKISAFIQGGIGNPALNIFKEGLQPFAIGGIKFLWNFGSVYTRKNDLNKIDNRINQIEVQKDIFSFDSSLLALQQYHEIKKYKTLSEEDDKIIQLREEIKKSSEAKVENGIMDTNDLIRDMNAEKVARINKSLHELEMIKAIYQLKYVLNK